MYFIIYTYKENTKDDFIARRENARFHPSILTTLYYKDSNTQ